MTDTIHRNRDKSGEKDYSGADEFYIRNEGCGCCGGKDDHPSLEDLKILKGKLRHQLFLVQEAIEWKERELKKAAREKQAFVRKQKAEKKEVA